MGHGQTDGSTRTDHASTHPRHDSELQALYETLSDISSLLAPDLVLEAITTRTRSALHADLCYFSLVDPWNSNHSARMSTGRDQEWLHDDFVILKPNQGVAGRVASTREVFSTSDYFGDPAVQHGPTVDEVVLREGIVSIAGAPLLNGDALHGVLLVAFRERHEWVAKELVFLHVIAGHAAVALGRAQLISDLERQNVELANALDEVRTKSTQIEDAQRQHESLTSLVLAGAEAREVVRKLGEIVGTDVTYLEQSEPSNDPGSGLTVEVRAGARSFGSLVLAGVDSIDDQQRMVLQRGANVVALSRLLEVSMLDSDSRARIDLLTDLLAGRVAGEAAEIRTTATIGRSWRRGTAVVSASINGARSDVEIAARTTARRWNGLFVVDHESAFIAAPATDSERLAREFEAELSERNVTAFLGHARNDHGLKGVRDLHKEAVHVADALWALQSDLKVSSSTELGIIGLVLGARRDGAASLIERTLGPVLAYDDKHKTDLEVTLRAYFATGQVLADTARTLLVHPKTVSQRVARIKNLLGPTSLEGDRAMELFIALRLRDILGARAAG